MTRLHLVAGLVAATMALLGAAYWWGGANAIRDREADENTAINETEKGIADAINRCADMPWYDRLRTDCR